MVAALTCRTLVLTPVQVEVDLVADPTNLATKRSVDLIINQITWGSGLAVTALAKVSWAYRRSRRLRSRWGRARMSSVARLIRPRRWCADENVAQTARE